MRRTILLGLLAALLLAPAAYAGGTTTQILRDCADDGILEGHYTPAELRKARDDIPTDIAEYSDCSDVLARALASGTASHSGGSGGGAPPSSGGGPPGAGGDTQQFSDAAANGPRALLPSTPAEQQALGEAAGHGGEGDIIAGRPLAPAADIGGHFGRNALPGSLIVVLVLLAGAALAMIAPTVIRRVGARKTP